MSAPQCPIRRYPRARRESQLATAVALVPSLGSDLRPGAARGQPGAGAPRRLARTAARAAGPSCVGRRAGPVESGQQPLAQAELAGTLCVHLRLAGLRAAGAGGRHRGGALPDRHRDQHARTGFRRARPGSAENRRGGHVDHRRAAARSDPVRRQPAHRAAAQRRSVHRSAATRPGTSSRGHTADRPGHRQSLQIHRRGRKRHGSHRVRR